MWKRPSFRPVSAFNMPSSLSLTISSFWFKVRDGWLFSLEHLVTIVGLLIGLISVLCVSGNREAQGRETWDSRSVQLSEHTQHLAIKFAVLHDLALWDPTTITVVTSKITITNYRNKYNNENVWKSLWELSKCDPETPSEQTLLEKWCRVASQGCHKPVCKNSNTCEVQYSKVQ